MPCGKIGKVTISRLFLGSKLIGGLAHSNLWWVDPEKTAAFMEKVDKPWVAFKVMAAGAIYPRHGFSFAFRGGADFVVAGMFDFQVAEDVKIAAEVLSHIKTRQRPWRG